jgi:hypothetical protein
LRLAPGFALTSIPDTFGLYATASWHINQGGTVFEDGRIREIVPEGIAEYIAGRVRIGGQQLVEGG